MKKLFAILVLAVAFIANAGNLKAQITVSGIVVDSLSGQGVPFATVTVATSATSTDYLMTGMTDVDGAFKGTIKKPEHITLLSARLAKTKLITNSQFRLRKTLSTSAKF